MEELFCFSTVVNRIIESRLTFDISINTHIHFYAVIRTFFTYNFNQITVLCCCSTLHNFVILHQYIWKTAPDIFEAYQNTVIVRECRFMHGPGCWYSIRCSHHDSPPLEFIEVRHSESLRWNWLYLRVRQLNLRSDSLIISVCLENGKHKTFCFKTFCVFRALRDLISKIVSTMSARKHNRWMCDKTAIMQRDCFRPA